MAQTITGFSSLWSHKIFRAPKLFLDIWFLTALQSQRVYAQPHFPITFAATSQLCTVVLLDQSPVVLGCFGLILLDYCSSWANFWGFRSPSILRATTDLAQSANLFARRLQPLWVRGELKFCVTREGSWHMHRLFHLRPLSIEVLTALQVPILMLEWKTFKVEPCVHAAKTWKHVLGLGSTVARLRYRYLNCSQVDEQNEGHKFQMGLGWSSGTRDGLFEIRCRI